MAENPTSAAPGNAGKDGSPDIATNLTLVRTKIADAASDSDRSPENVKLVAVSKTHDLDAVIAALQAGQRCFGENRVQEAEQKFPGLRSEYPDLELHLIGPLQTNKAAMAVALFDVIQTLDRPKLAHSLAKEMAKADRRPRCFIQINTGEEPQKAGVSPADSDAFVALVRDELGLPLEGLMCIPPQDEAPALHFALLAEIARRNGLTELSMGMSHDYEIAVQLGATVVRVGTAIFGARPARP